VPTYSNNPRKSQKKVLPAEDFRRKYQEKEKYAVRSQKLKPSRCA
jgi:hypothetical protein